MKKLVHHSARYLPFLSLLIAATASAGGGGGGGGVAAANVPAPSVLMLAGAQLTLAFVYSLWRRK
ncbi:MAG: hypothetical protein R3C68_07960 [Myxococcota bacterium]